MEEKKLGFIQRLVIAVAKPKEYYKTVRQGSGRVIGFIAILLVITTFCGFPLDYIKASASTNGFKDIISEYVPEFDYSNGRLDMEESYCVDRDGVYVYIDTDYEEFTLDDLREVQKTGDYKEIFLLGAKKGCLYNGGKYQELDLSQLSTLTFDKEKLVSLMKTINVLAVVGILFLYIGIFAWYLFMSMIYAVIGTIFKKSLSMGPDITFGQIFLMAISAKVTMRILLAICKLFNVTIPYFGWISVAVTLVYLYFGLKGLRDNNAQMGYQAVNQGMQYQQPYNNGYGYQGQNQNPYNQGQPNNYNYQNQGQDPRYNQYGNQNMNPNGYQGQPMNQGGYPNQNINANGYQNMDPNGYSNQNMNQNGYQNMNPNGYQNQDMNQNGYQNMDPSGYPNQDMNQTGNTNDDQNQDPMN